MAVSLLPARVRHPRGAGVPAGRAPRHPAAADGRRRQPGGIRSVPDGVVSRLGCRTRWVTAWRCSTRTSSTIRLVSIWLTTPPCPYSACSAGRSLRRSGQSPPSTSSSGSRSSSRPAACALSCGGGAALGGLRFSAGSSTPSDPTHPARHSTSTSCSSRYRRCCCCAWTSSCDDRKFGPSGSGC